MRQPTWNRHEVSLLIDAYIQIHDNGRPKLQVLSELSEALRRMATNKGLEIDDAYRNMNGMTWQYGFIEKAFEKSVYGGHMPSKLFIEMVHLYKDEPQKFESLLREAQSMCKSDSDSFLEKSEDRKAVSCELNKEKDFESWLNEQTNLKASASTVIAVLRECSEYSIKHGIIKKDFWSIDDAKVYLLATKKLLFSKFFRITNRKLAKIFDKTYRYYADFLQSAVTAKQNISEPTLQEKVRATPPVSESAVSVPNESMLLEQFTVWLTSVEQVSERTSMGYTSNLRSLKNYCEKNGLQNNFLRLTGDDLSAFVEELFLNENFAEYNAQQHNRFSAALKKFVKFISGENDVNHSRTQTIPEKISIGEVATVSFLKAQTYAGTKPCFLSLLGEEIAGVRSWTDVYCKMAEVLSNHYPEVVDSICRDFHDGKCAAILAYKEDADKFARPVSAGERYVVEANRSAENIIRNIKWLLDRCRVNCTDVVIQYVTRSATVPAPGKEETTKHDAWKPAYSEQLELLISEYYQYGFRIGSPIELIRLRKYAEARNIALPESDEELNREIEAVGMNIEGKVYVLQAEVQEALCQKTREVFESGAGVVFLEVLYEKENEFFEEHHVTSAEMLKEILRRNAPTYYYGQNIVTPGKKQTEVEAILSEITRICGNGNIITVDALIEDMVYVPAEKIVWTLSYSDNMIRIAEGKYFRLEDFIISDEDTQAILKYVEDTCDSYGFVALADIPLGNLAEENYELTESGLQKAVYASVLKNGFRLNGKILTRNTVKLDLQSVLRDFCRDRAECTAQDVMEKMEELGNAPTKRIALQVLFDTMVRVDRDRFVADNQIDFDIAAIDSLLREYIGARFATIQSIPTFALFPMCGSPWNHSLLESYCYRFSKEYQLSVKEMNSKNAGFIASTTLSMSYQDMLCESAAMADIDLTPEALGAYFFDNGFTANRRYAMLPEIIEKAKKLREEG